jgi:hypothetical protein
VTPSNETSEGSTAAVFRRGEQAELDDPSKRQQIFAVIHGATSHETVIFIVTDLRTSNQFLFLWLF